MKQLESSFMTYLFRSFVAPVAAFALAVSMPLAALAQQDSLADLVGKALIGTMSKVSGDTFAYEKARFDEAANAVVLEKVTLTRDKAKRPSILIDATRILAPVMMDNGGFTADAVTTENVTLQSRALSGSIASATASNVSVQPADQIVKGALSQWFRYETSSVLDIQLGGKADARPLKIARFDSVASIDENNIPVAGEVNVEGISVAVNNIGRKRIREDILALGYEILDLSVKAKGAYDPENDTLLIENLEIAGKDAAALSMSASIGGIPESFMASPLDPRAIIATASIGNLDLKIDDRSLTGRVLSSQAKKMGTEPEALAAQLSGALPFFLAALQNDAFQKEVAEAVTAFLNEPKNFQVAMKPEKPTPFIQVFAALTSAPGTVVELLGLSISANQ